MASSNVEFFARMKRLQNQQTDSEQHRMELEHKFNTYLSSDKRLSRIKAAKLHRMWEKVCEDEKRSKARNDQLLKDYHRVETHMAALSMRTERLRLLKEQYERQVELMYPRWKEQLQARIVQQQITQQRKQQENSMQGYPVLNSTQQLTNTYPSQPNGSTIPQMQYGTMQYGQGYPGTANGTHPLHGTPMYGTQPYGGAQSQNGHIPQAAGQYGTQPQMPQTNGQFGAQPQMPQTIGQFGVSQQLQQSPGPYGAPGQIPQSSLPHGASPQLGQMQHSSVPHGASPQLGQIPHDASQQFVQMPHGSGPHGTSQKIGQMTHSTGQYGALPQNGLGAHGQSIPLQQTNAQTPTGHMSVDCQDVGPYRAQADGGQRLNLESQDSRVPDNKSPPLYDTLSRPNSKISAPVFDDSRGNYTQLMQDQNKSRLEPGSMNEPVEEEYSHLRRDSEDHLSGQVQQQQRIIQETSPENIRPNQNRPKAGSVAESSSTISVSSDSHYSGSEIRPQVKVTTSQPNRDSQVNAKHVNDTKQDNNKDYLIPTSETGGKDSKLDFVTPGRTARTEPFSSEGEEEEEDDEEEEDEDSAALRGALQEQLSSQDTASNPMLRVEVTKHDSSKEQGKPKQENTIQNEQEKNIPEDDDDIEESESEIGSEMSLPLSDTEGQVKQETRNITSSQTSALGVPSLTVKAFWTLVHTVEIEIEQSDDIAGIYNSPPCTEAIKKEIIKSANQNSGLSRLDPNAVSMVVLQTLPSMVATLPGGCLMSDKLLMSNRPINEISVRSFIYSAALGFWDQFLRHMTHLIKKGVLEPEEVAAKFAPQLISPDSNMADKAVKVLTQVLEDVLGEESFMDDSSMSMTQPTPQQRQTATREENRQHNLIVPPLNLGDTDRSDRTEEGSEEETEGDDDDSFFDNKVPLTETDAYQRLLGNTYDKPTTTSTAGDNKDDFEESSSEDEIEKAARITPETPSSANKKKRNILSSLGGALTNRSDDDDDDDIENQLQPSGDGGSTKRSGGGASTQRSDAVSSPSQSDLLSSTGSPPGTGYIPSAMEHSMKSTGRSDPMQRSAAFWGAESDMESEMSVPMGTGTMKSGEDKDDFDFYD